MVDHDGELNDNDDDDAWFFAPGAELQARRAVDSGDEADDDFAELIRDVECAREEAAAVKAEGAVTASSASTGVSGDIGSRFPYVLIERVALACDGDPSGLAWCSTCKHAARLRPPIRVLVLGDFWDGPAVSFPAMSDVFCLRLSSWSGALAEDSLARVSAKHAAEVTHLFLKVSHRTARANQGTPFEDFGALTAVRVLHVQHIAGHDDQSADATTRLLLAIRATLRTLCIESKHWSVNDALSVLQPCRGLAQRLTQLALLLLPNTPRIVYASGSPDATEALQACVAKACTSLAAPAWLCCHRPAMPLGEIAGWYRSMRPAATLLHDWYSSALVNV